MRTTGLGRDGQDMSPRRPGKQLAAALLAASLSACVFLPETTVKRGAGGSPLLVTEDGGLLYIRTSHEMYASSDGLNHQASLSFTVRQDRKSVV